MRYLLCYRVFVFILLSSFSLLLPSSSLIQLLLFLFFKHFPFQLLDIALLFSINFFFLKSFGKMT